VRSCCNLLIPHGDDHAEEKGRWRVTVIAVMPCRRDTRPDPRGLSPRRPSRAELQLVSLYVDQSNADDLSPTLPRSTASIVRHHRRGPDACSKTLAVDGVISVASTAISDRRAGTNPVPASPLFRGSDTDVCRTGKAVPVFNDKHLAATCPMPDGCYESVARAFRAVHGRFVMRSCGGNRP